jgi:RNA polymerase sigma-70 factor (ECF subfamily)
MSESPATRPTLLVRLRDVRDGAAWAEFVQLYAPLVYGLGRKHGLQDADAADLAQDVLRAVVGAVPQFVYDPCRGSFRGWLFTVARNQLRKFALARRHQAQGSGDSADVRRLEELPAREEDAAAWDQDYRERLFAWAAERVRDGFRPATWQAFWRTTVQGEEVPHVAAALDLSVGAVYIARSRVLARIKQEIERVQGEDAVVI